MPPTLPIYEAHGRTYTADTCRPLVEAAQRGEVVLEALVHGHYPGRRLRRSALRGVKSIGFWNAARPQSWSLDWHCNEGIEITFLEHGRLDFAVDDQRFELAPDDLTVTRPWQRHRVGRETIPAGRLHWLILDVGVRRPDQPWRWPSWIVLTRGDLDDLTRLLRHNEHPVWPATAEIRYCFQRIAGAVTAEDPRRCESPLIVRINELLVLLLQLLRNREIPLDESLTGTRRSVELFLDDLGRQPERLIRQWTVRRMAESCGLGVTQFTRYCRQITNMTPLHYLNHLRLEAAARLLRGSNLSIHEIARRCGFRSSQYFATAFRQRYGCSPRRYREQTSLSIP